MNVQHLAGAWTATVRGGVCKLISLNIYCSYLVATVSLLSEVQWWELSKMQGRLPPLMPRTTNARCDEVGKVIEPEISSTSDSGAKGYRTSA